MKISKQRTGKAAHGQISQRVGVRIPNDVMQQIQAICDENNIGKSAVIIYLLKKGLDSYTTPKRQKDPLYFSQSK